MEKRRPVAGDWMNIGYIESLPERGVRAVAAVGGGAIYEATEVLLPGWLRRSRLYRAVIATFLRIVVELVGGVTGVLPSDDVDVGQLAVRKAAGNVIEIAGLLAIGWSPLWLLAAVADLTGGTRTYLRALVAELRRDGFLSQDEDIASAEELLSVLENASGLMADTVDVPPLNVRDMRRSWHALRQNVADLPDASRLSGLYTQLERVARQEGRSLRSVSSIVAAGAARAGVQMGHAYVFDYYTDALRTISSEGLAAYARRVSKPYLSVAKNHLHPKCTTLTERLLQRLGIRSTSKTERGD